LDWYRLNKRYYPWRISSNPFHILTAEFMLQQTHVRAVPNVYIEFIRNYPEAKTLADADLVEVEQYFLPLGLSYRAERLKRCAINICHVFNGFVPSNRSELLSLPGVGEYMADAVLCYGFGKPAVPIDTNVIRLFCRFFGFTSNKPRPRTDKVLAEEIRSRYKKFDNTREANLAVLDFASIVCSAKKPQCIKCPLKKKCINLVGNEIKT